MSYRLVACLVLPILAACGGGGGGGESPINQNARFTLNTNTVFMTADESSGRAPQAQVTGGVTGATDSVFVRVTITSGEAIIDDATLNISGTSGTLLITAVAPNQLSAGTYTANIRAEVCNDAACSSQISGSPQTVAVTYEVTSTTLTPSETQIDFVTSLRTPASRRISLEVSDGPDAWSSTISYTGSSGWLVLDPPSGNSLPQAITFTASGMDPGTYSAAVTFETDAQTASVTVPVTYTVEPFEIDVREASVDFQFDNTTNDAGLLQQLVVASGTGVDFDWSASVDVDWVTLSIDNGNTADATPLTISVNEELAFVNNGVHSATLTFNQTSGGTATLSLPVNLDKTARYARFAAPYVVLPGVVQEVTLRGEGLAGLQLSDVSVGSFLPTAVQVVSDSAATITLPTLPAGQHAVSLARAASLSLDNASLIAASTPAFPAAELDLSPGRLKSSLIYDAERQTVYALTDRGTRLERYRWDGATWNMDDTVLINNAWTGQMHLSNDGTELICFAPGFHARFDLETFSELGSVVSGDRDSFDALLSDGRIFLHERFEIYDPYSDSYSATGGVDWIQNRNINRLALAPSGDRNIVFMSVRVSFGDPYEFYVYDARTNLVSALDSFPIATEITTANFDGTMFAALGRVYHISQGEIGTLQEDITSGAKFSRDGTQLFYNRQVGLFETADADYYGADLTSPDGAGGFDPVFAPLFIDGANSYFDIDPEARMLFIGGDRLRLIVVP